MDGYIVFRHCYILEGLVVYFDYCALYIEVIFPSSKSYGGYKFLTDKRAYKKC